MASPKSTRRSKRTVSSIEREIDETCEELAKIRQSKCFSLLLGEPDIRSTLVDRVYDELKGEKHDFKSLDIIIDSGGGDIDAAYNLARLFRRYGKERLTFIIPRWAKSAATLLICAGDEILMTPVAELGPLDPQITAMNRLEQRVESFSPLHIESTLQLIREEFSKGNSQLAEGLMQRLQFPLTLGSFKKLLDVGREYVEKLLSSRMLKGNESKAEHIGKVLTTGYAHHSWCITIEEAQELGLKAKEIEGTALDLVWRIHKLNRERDNLVHQNEQAKLQEKLKELPPGLLEAVPPGVTGDDPQTKDVPSQTGTSRSTRCL